MTSSSTCSTSAVPRRRNLITTSCPVSSSLHMSTSGAPSARLLHVPRLHSSFSFLYLHAHDAMMLQTTPAEEKLVKCLTPASFLQVLHADGLSQFCNKALARSKKLPAAMSCVSGESPHVLLKDACPSKHSTWGVL